VVLVDQDPSTTTPFDIPNAVSTWNIHQNPCVAAEVDVQKGAIRLATIDCSVPATPVFTNWKPRDTFARMTDGTANTILVGEKHIRNGEIGKYGSSMDDQDGVYLFTSASGGRNYNVARNLSYPLANGPNDKRFSRGQSTAKGPAVDFGFGSWHSGGVIIFGKGDGTVTTINYNIAEQVKRRLGHCQDGLNTEESGAGS